jgi:NitT/TauT family transport system substrate-binding protein
MNRLLYLLAISLLALVGCSGQDANTDRAQPSQTAKAGATAPAVRSDKTSFRIAWSRYTGWEPWALAEKNGILKKWADKYGIKIELVYVDNYVGSIERYSKGEFDGCTMTNIDALTLPAASGVDSTALIIGDYSNGNDGLVLRNAQSVAGLQGRSVRLVEYSVSHYLLDRAGQINGIGSDRYKIVNTPETEIAALFSSDAGGAAVTWNPHLSVVAAVPGSSIAFDSADIQGEILDLMVIRSDSPDSLRNALVGAWYETMTLLTSEDAGKRSAAIEFMARNSGVSAAEFERQLETTAMFYFPWDGASFANSPNLRDTMDRARDFAFRNGLLGKGAKSADAIGIALSDGNVVGDAKNVKLRFTADYMRQASLDTIK